MSVRTCEDGCNGCDDCTDYDDEPRDPPEFGCCLPPGECCMPGLHFPSECHTAADYERGHGADWRETPNAAGNRLARQGQSELTGLLGPGSEA